LKRAIKDIAKAFIIGEEVKESSTSDIEAGWDEEEDEDDKGREIFEAYIEWMSLDQMI
jgi:hypothetical protein